MVSHFSTEKEQRVAFYESIFTRLKSKGLLVNAELSGNLDDQNTKSLLNAWQRTLKFTGMPDQELQKMLSSFGTKVALLSPQQIASLLEKSGFVEPVLFFQALLIHVWYSAKGV